MNRDINSQDSYLFDGIVFEKLNPLVEKAVNLLFRKVEFDNESLQTLKDYADKNLVYASFHTSNFSLLLLYTLLRKYRFKTPIFALEYNPFLLQSVKYIAKRLSRLFSIFFLRKRYKDILETDYVEELLRNKRSILVSLLSRKFFLRRYIEVKYDSLMYLIDLQKKMEEPIYLLPEMIFWNMNPERSKSLLESKATGDRGLISGWLTITKSLTPSFIRISKPINLKEEIENSPVQESKHLAMRLRNRLLDIYHHEKRTVLGPVIKSRQEMMEKVLYHKNVLDEIEKVHGEKRISERKLKKKAYKYYKEIAADFSIIWIQYFAMAVGYMFRKIFDGISFDQESLKKIREAAQKGPLILTPCHKSHMDYLLISWLFYKNMMIPPHIAAGVNLSFFPIGPVFRHSGAFFLRRSFKGLDLYPVIFKQYIKTLVNEGYPVEFFIEGGRSRTGKLVLPRMGLLNYLIEAVEEGYNKDLVFVPVSINYDRILEESSYLQELKGKEKEAESMGSFVESRKLLKRKYGRVYLAFNEPFTLKELVGEETGNERMAQMVAGNIIKRINEVTVVTPFALTTMAILLKTVKGFSWKLIFDRMVMLYKYLAAAEVSMSDSLQRKANLESIVEQVLSTYQEDKIIEPLKMEGGRSGSDVDDFFVLREENRARIAFYKNSIIHYFIPVAFYSLALLYLQRKSVEITPETIRTEYGFIKDLFSREFVYSADVEDIFSAQSDVVRDFLLSEGLMVREGNGIKVQEEKADVLRLYGAIIKDFLESYLVVVDTLLSYRRKTVNRKDFIVEVRKSGIKMFHTGEVGLAESLSLPNYNNALSRLEDMGILSETPGGGKNAEIEIAEGPAAGDLLGKIRDYLDIVG